MSWEESLGKSIERACEILPIGCVIHLHLEKHGYGLELTVDGEEIELESCESIIDEIECAVSLAVKLNKSAKAQE